MHPAFGSSTGDGAGPGVGGGRRRRGQRGDHARARGGRGRHRPGAARARGAGAAHRGLLRRPHRRRPARTAGHPVHGPRPRRLRRRRPPPPTTATPCSRLDAARADGRHAGRRRRGRAGRDRSHPPRPGGSGRWPPPGRYRLAEACEGPAPRRWSRPRSRCRSPAGNARSSPWPPRACPTRRSPDGSPLSVRTVEGHLYRAGVELGTSNRGEFAALLRGD